MLNLIATLNFVVPIELCTKVMREPGAQINYDVMKICFENAHAFAIELIEIDFRRAEALRKSQAAQAEIFKLFIRKQRPKAEQPSAKPEALPK